MFEVLHKADHRLNRAMAAVHVVTCNCMSALGMQYKCNAEGLMCNAASLKQIILTCICTECVCWTAHVCTSFFWCPSLAQVLVKHPRWLDAMSASCIQKQQLGHASAALQ